MNEEVYENYKEVNDSYDEVTVQKVGKRTGSYYDGRVLDVLACNTLNILISAGTATLAAPWVNCMAINYNISHTGYNGKRLKFDGKGEELFIEKFRWMFFSIITLGIYALWIPVNKQKWIVSKMHFEDEILIDGESYFDGGVLGFIGVNLVSIMLTILSLGLLYPVAVCYKERWIAKHTIINRKRIIFTGTALNLYGNYVAWWLLTIVTLGLYGFWLPVKLADWKAKNTHIKTVNENYQSTSILPMIIGVVLFIAALCIGGALIYDNLSNSNINPKSFNPYYYNETPDDIRFNGADYNYTDETNYPYY